MVILKSGEEIDIMRRCGKIVMAVLDKLRTEVKPGLPLAK